MIRLELMRRIRQNANILIIALLRLHRFRRKRDGTGARSK